MYADIYLDGNPERKPADQDFGKFFNTVTRRSNFRLIEVHGDHTFSTPLDLTSLRQNIVYDFLGARLTAKLESGTEHAAVVDLTDSDGLHIRGLHLTSNQENPAYVGVLVSRSVRNPHNNNLYRSAGSHIFEHCHVVGYYLCAAVYNIGSETNYWLRLHSVNDHPDGMATVIMAKQNMHRVLSFHNNLIPQNNVSSTGQVFVAPRLRFQGGVEIFSPTAENVPDSDHSALVTGTLVVEGFDRISCNGAYLQSSKAPYVTISTRTNAVEGVSLDDLYTHGVSLVEGSPPTAIWMTGNFGAGIVSLRIRAFQIATRDCGIACTDKLKLTNLHIEHHEEPTRRRPYRDFWHRNIEWNGTCRLTNRSGTIIRRGTTVYALPPF
jgi:hypothetical protein